MTKEFFFFFFRKHGFSQLVVVIVFLLLWMIGLNRVEIYVISAMINNRFIVFRCSISFNFSIILILCVIFLLVFSLI